MKKFIYAASAFALPIAALAQQTKDAFDLAGLISRLLNTAVPILIAAAVVWVLWGAVQYITGAGGEEAKEKGKNTMIYGIVAIFVMVSIWGLVNILIGTFNLNTTAPTSSIPNLQRDLPGRNATGR
jgi:hypothetical protein